MEKVNLGSQGRTAVRTDGAHDDSVVTRNVGLGVAATFCPDEVADPFDTVEWELRTAGIKGDRGEMLFEQTDCEIPSDWSQLATNVVASKYFYGEVGTNERETGVRQLVHRVCRTIADWGIEDGYFATEEDGERFYRELVWLCIHQCAAFNSPVWFNVGLHHQYGVKGGGSNWSWDPELNRAVQPENSYEYPQASACFIQSVQDNMEDIMELARSEAMLFKFGSGTGTDLSTLRSHREKLAGGGKPSGPLSFMRVYDQIAAVVKSGGKTRRAAKMQSLKVWHPDILEFIECKGKEEKKAILLMQEGGYNYEEAYNSILFQNANLSVRLTDDFMEAVETDQQWTTRWVTDSTHEGPTYKAKELMQKMAEATHRCGDPGVQYDTIINRWHTCPNSERINASNPCSEYMFVDDSACNLASINLMKFRSDDCLFDHERFQAACRLVFIAQEILVDHASYPTKRIAANSHRFRPIGLGYSNLGSLLMSNGLPYDSEEGRAICGSVTAILHGTANLTSAELASAMGPFDAFEENRVPMLRVMQRHRDEVDEIEAAPAYLRQAATRIWDQVITYGHRDGFRNAQATVLAPTGTISFMMDCDTTGIEPDIALVKFKQLAGGGVLKIVNQTIPLGLKTLGYDNETIRSIISYIEKEGTIEGAADLQDAHLPVFDCAFQAEGGIRTISWIAHVQMMAAAQPFISGAISKTVNMPADSTVDDVRNAYMEGWRLGLKALAIYRDGSKGAQPLSTKNAGSKEKKNKGKLVAAPRRERLPDTRQSITHKFSVAGHEGYLNVGLYPDGRPGELFITMAKEGSTIGGLMGCFGTSVSMSLQYGVPLEVYVKKFSHTRFEPQGHTTNPDIRIAKSIVDYIFRWLGITFLSGYMEANNAIPGASGKSSAVETDESDSKPASKKEGGPGIGQGQAVAKTTSTKIATGGNGSYTKARISMANSFEAYESVTTRARANASVESQFAMVDSSPTSGAAAMGAKSFASRTEQFASFQADAPPCDSCGAITVRNGNCYLCHNCGASMGCS
jgi:ribonucleoside-diphosphate reductase alpha chain